MTKKRLNIPVVLLTLLLAALGCAKPSVKCVSPEDNPKHHYLQGMELIEENKLDDASVKFERALYCDDGFGPAYAGSAIASALKASTVQGKPAQSDIDKVYENLKHASKYSATKEDEFAAYLGSMRVYTALKPRKWLNKAEGDYKNAMKLKVDEKNLVYYDGREAATYFMGIAYLEAREFQSARDMFANVLSGKRESKWNAPADRHWKKADKIVRALAGITVGDVGKEIAVMDSVTREDMAALLVDEMKVEKLFEGRIPVKSETEKIKVDFVPDDLANNPFREEALTMMKWKIRGFEPVYDSSSKSYRFKPYDNMTRKEFAMALEDILIKIMGNESLYSAFLGHVKSPFPDVPATAAWYNAVMNVTTRNIMETELSGEFRLNDAVHGAEALLAVRILRQRLTIY